MYSKIFRYDDQGNIRPVTIRESQIDCVSEILRSDTGSPGDYDGRKKAYAHKIFKACMWIGDPNSLGNQQGYDGDQLIADAVSNAELPENWKPDANCKKLIALVREHYSGGVAKEYIDNLLKSMRTISNTTKIITARIEKTIEGSDGDISDDRLSVLASMQKQMIDIASSAPKHIAALKQTLADLRIEETEQELSLGGNPVTYSMREHGQ